jgi:hypothetical protein
MMNAYIFLASALAVIAVPLLGLAVLLDRSRDERA